MMEVVSGDNWSCKMCKAPVKLSSSTNKDSMFTDRCPSCHPPTVRISVSNMYVYMYVSMSVCLSVCLSQDNSTSLLPITSRYHVSLVIITVFSLLTSDDGETETETQRERDRDTERDRERERQRES